MPIKFCTTCAKQHYWRWEEAFDKFGFGDGDGQVETENIAEILRKAGYEVETERWGCHNVVIISITLNGIECIPEDAVLGYDQPREYLPKEIVDILDGKLPAFGYAKP